MKITKEESKKRREIWEEAKASCELEGGELSEKQLELGKRYIAGEISALEYGEIIRRDLLKINAE